MEPTSPGWRIWRCAPSPPSPRVVIHTADSCSQNERSLDPSDHRHFRLSWMRHDNVHRRWNFGDFSGGCRRARFRVCMTKRLRPKMIQTYGALNQPSMSAYRHASRLFPGTTVWISDVDGFVWVATEPEVLCETDELHVSWVRWTSRHGRHRIRLTYWVRTDVQMQSDGPYSDATHIRWTEPSTPPPSQRLPPPDAPNRPVGHSRRSVQTAHCARRLAFDQV